MIRTTVSLIWFIFLSNVLLIFLYSSPIPNTYFSKFIPDDSQVKPSPCKEIQQDVKAKQNNEEFSIEDCTDSELLAIDIEATTELVAANDDAADGVTSNVTAGVTENGVTLSGSTGVNIATDNELIPGDDVTGDDAAGDCITSNDITDSGITCEGITADGVTSDCVTADGLNSDDVTDFGVTVDDITDSGITTEGIFTDDVTSSDITANCVTSSDMTTNGVTSSNMTSDGASLSDISSQETSSGHQPSVCGSTPDTEESRPDISNQSSQQIKQNTWISVVSNVHLLKYSPLVAVLSLS